MRIYLAQHGLAEPKDVDPGKPLSDAGRGETQAVARAIAGRVAIQRIRHSGKLRARETAEIFGRELGIEAIGEAPGMAPLDDVRAFAAGIGEDGVLYVGHLPHLARLVAWLTTGSEEPAVVRFCNSGVLCLETEGEAAAVSWYLTPELVA